MAGIDDILTSPAASYIFGGNTGVPSQQALEQRRKLALAYAMQRRAAPKTLGEGMTYLGEAVGQRANQARLDQAEQARFEELKKMFPGGGGAPAAGAPAVAAGSAIAPPSGPNTRPYTTVPIRPTSDTERPLPRGLIDPALIGDVSPVDEQRNRIAALLPPEGVAQENPTEGAPLPAPLGSQLALASPTGTMSDAPPIGMSGGTTVENPPTPTDIAPMPTMLAQAGAGAPAGRAGPAGPATGPTSIPGPYAPPAPLPPAPAFGLPIPPQFSTRPVKPPPPDLTPLSPEEVHAQRMMMQRPGDSEVATMAQLYAAPYAARRQALDVRNAEVFKADLERYDALAKKYDEESTPAGRLRQSEGEQKAAREEQEIRQFGNIGGRDFFRDKVLLPSYEAVKTMPATILATNAARQALQSDPKMFTGAPADIKLSIAKLAGFFGADVDLRVPPTEMFKSFMAPLMASMRSAIVGAGPQSEKEFSNLQTAVGSDFKLERGSIEGILNQIERINRSVAMAHQSKLEVFTANDANLQRMYYPSLGISNETLSRLVPKEAIDHLIKDAADPKAWQEFNDNFHSPGLAQHILRQRMRR